MDVRVEPKKTRTITIEVSDDEAASTAGWLTDALHSNLNTPYRTEGVRALLSAFSAIRDGK